MLAVLAACASNDVPQGGLGPPYNVPADPEQPTQAECIQVFCANYPEYESDPKYCCIGGILSGQGDKD